MVVFPNCKINLGLNIINKRADGFHNLETCFLPIPHTDALEIIPSNNQANPVEFTCTGLPVAGNPGDNLCVKAYWLLKNQYPALPAVKIHLLKAIPMGAGLGGGSADGAFTLMLLNNKFRLGIADEQLQQYALQLGSDCPFFVVNKPALAEQRGEKLHPVALNLKGYKLLLVNPGIHINTGWAFSQIKPGLPAKKIHNIIQQPVETWKDELVNDFEQPVINNYPQLGVLKKLLYTQGAVYAAMSGSGSTFYGIFNSNVEVAPNIFPAEYFTKQVIL
jgi:4-diphosphocytidyl-2-C-methyl-D-erythritol kinase